ncbi:lysine--tRNA ligase [Candidatus Omnitrophota bacterium]
MELKEIIEQRIGKLKSLKAKGLSIYGNCKARPMAISEALGDFQDGRQASFCGRIIAKRSHGKVTFLDLKDSTAKIQLYIKEDSLGQEGFGIFQDSDIADIVAVRGELFKTRTGEPSLKTQDFQILSKALRPLPEKWHGLKDTDIRYRQRYLDILSNDEVKKVFLQRSRIIASIRAFLDEKGFLEVETPMMHYNPGGAAGRPFKTSHNEYGLDLYLRIAPELYLKRLLVGGLEKVYEINRSFRNEGVSTKHNPEFTMLEVYSAYADYRTMMQLCQELFAFVAGEVLGKTSFDYQGRHVDLAAPWKELSFAETVKKKFGVLPQDSPEEMLNKLKEKGFAKDAKKLTRSQIAKIIEDILEEDLTVNPTFVTDYFTNLCPLAKSKQSDPAVSERFELYVAGLEIANAYSELNDPQEQEIRFREEIKEAASQEKKEVDDDYVLALEHGMPPAGGLGIGIDRLVMLLTDQPSIRDVILFPLLRPKDSE